MFYYTYVLLREVDDLLYVEWTVDLVNRLKKHNAGLMQVTKARKPLTLLYYEAVGVKKELLVERNILKQALEEDF